jgi:hypothetical protein
VVDVEGTGPAGLGRQKSTLRPLDEEGEDVTQSGARGYGHGNEHTYGYYDQYRHDDQGRSPYTTTKTGTDYSYPPGPYPFGAQARSPAPGRDHNLYTGPDAVRPVSAARLSGLSYVDEEGGCYRSGSGSGSKNNVGGFGGRQGEKHGGEEEGESLVGGAAYPAGSPFLDSEWIREAGRSARHF